MTTRTNRASGSWLFGPSVERLWRARLAYILVFSLLMVSARVISVLPGWIVMFLVVLLSLCARKVDDTPKMRSLRARLEGAVGAGLRHRS